MIDPIQHSADRIQYSDAGSILRPLRALSFFGRQPAQQ